jgi:predicted nucleic acid-binding protein
VLVVADTGPLHYLILIGHVDLLPRLFGSITIPTAVRDELDQPATPACVRMWISSPPRWLTIMSEPDTNPDAALAALDNGEQAAIVLAVALRAELVLMDDRLGVAAARSRGFAVTGTLGALDRAARRGLIDLAAAFADLRATNFHTRPALLDALVAAWKKDRGE